MTDRARGQAGRAGRFQRAAHRVGTGLRDLLVGIAHSRGWTTAALAYPGYAADGRARVLARLLLAPPGSDPGTRRDAPGWRRVLTLVQPGANVDIALGDARMRASSGAAGLVDTTIEVELPSGSTTALLHVPGRPPVAAAVHVAPTGASRGVVCDIDDTVWLTGLRQPLRAAWRTLVSSSGDRRPVAGMSALLGRLVEGQDHPPVVYLSNGPWNLAGPITRLLDRHGFPSGVLLMTNWGITRRGWFRDGQAHKRGALQRLARDFPGVRWVLVGDDGEHDPDLYRDFALEHHDRVAAIVLRTVAPPEEAAPDADERVGNVPVVRGSDSRVLEERLNRLGPDLAGPGGPDGPAAWFLTAAERGNDATRLRAWTEGNSVRALVHGRTYFPVLAEVLEDVGDGDLVLFTDWRGDPDERLTDDGPGIGDVLSRAARRGALVKGLLWRSHLDRLQFSAEQNRDLSEHVNHDGGEVLLDQRVRPMGSHHQKFVVVRHADDPSRDVAFVGGIDLGHSRRDDAEHGGDPQTQPFADPYGGSPAWHDVQVELRGPAVREVEDCFRERWEDPAALSRLPWQVIPDRLRGLEREESHLPEPRPDPPHAGRCAVQLLRTYPNRWPGYPFAPDGERSAARAYTKAMRRARRLVYVEDQYLWSVDVAKVFANALRAQPRLHLIAVVPRFPDQDGRFGVPPVLLGHTMALAMVREAGGDRVQIVDVENRSGEPVYVHAKVCIVDDVWAAVGSDNFNRRSWTHDSELSAAVLDEERDTREPADPAGLGDGARRFARALRLELLREHLDRTDDQDGDLVDPETAAEAVRASAQRLAAWHADGCDSPRPPGRLRPHRPPLPPRWQRILAAPAYRVVFDPDGRPPRMKLRRTL